MSYQIIWQPNSEITYFEEIDFIFRKWNYKEVQKFQDLVFENLNRLEENPLIGKYHKLLNIYAVVISKQTTLYYNFNQKDKVIDLYVFWNNLKSPENINNLL